MRGIIASMLLAIILTACSSVPEPPGETIIPTSTVNPTPTVDPYGEYPKQQLLSDADLYQGPGNLDFDVLRSLPADNSVVVLGSYGDFVKVFEPDSKTTGFVYKNFLPPLSSGVPVLPYQDVPWITEDLMVDYFSGPFTTVDQNGLATFHNYIPGPGWYAPNGAPIPLGQETHIRIQMETSNENPVWIALKNRQRVNEWIEVNNTLVNADDHWYLGYNSVTLFWQPDDSGGRYEIDFRDGQLNHIIYPTPLKRGMGPMDLVILGSTGTAIEWRDMEGNVIVHYDTRGDFSLHGDLVQFPNGVFPEGVVYPDFGSTGPTTVTSEIHDLYRAPTGSWLSPPAELADLRDLAQKNGIDIIIPVAGWVLSDKRFSRIARSQVTMDYNGEPTASHFWEGIGKYNFEFLDALVEYKVSQGWKQMFNIVYGWGGDNAIAIPPDLKTGTFTRQEYIDILHEYVSAVACRYKDKVNVWSIAGESPSMRDFPEADFWLKRIGPEYVDLSFQWVRDCDPDGILILADTFDSPRSPEMTYTIESTYTMAKDMIDEGVPIDGVGLEGHMFLPWNTQEIRVIPNYKDVYNTMKRFADLGLDIYITEMDVNLVPFEGTREEKWVFQAGIYKLMLDACLDTGRCKSFGVFGVDDKHNWPGCPTPLDVVPEGYCLPTTQADPLWFDDNFNPKPAYWAIVQSLEEHLK